MNFGTGLNDIVGLVMAVMFYENNSTEPAGLILVSILRAPILNCWQPRLPSSPTDSVNLQTNLSLQSAKYVMSFSSIFHLKLPLLARPGLW